MAESHISLLVVRKIVQAIDHARVWIASRDSEHSERARIKLETPHRRLDDDQFPKTFVGTAIPCLKSGQHNKR